MNITQDLYTIEDAIIIEDENEGDDNVTLIPVEEDDETTIDEVEQYIQSVKAKVPPKKPLTTKQSAGRKRNKLAKKSRRTNRK